MEALPISHGTSAEAPVQLSAFRLQTQAEVGAVLRELQVSRALVTISTPDGAAYTTTVWDVEPARGTISFAADAEEGRLSQLLDSDEAVGIAYLEHVKVQFDVQALVLVRGNRHAVLNCALPREVYRIQRRESFRVRPLGHSVPVARFQQVGSDVDHALRVINVSLGGVALSLPAGGPHIEPGTRLKGVRLELDADTEFVVDLHIHHATVSHREGSDTRLGCEFLHLEAANLRILQRYIDQTQKRRRLLALND